MAARTFESTQDVNANGASIGTITFSATGTDPTDVTTSITVTGTDGAILYSGDGNVQAAKAALNANAKSIQDQVNAMIRQNFANAAIINNPTAYTTAQVAAAQAAFDEQASNISNLRDTAQLLTFSALEMNASGPSSVAGEVTNAINSQLNGSSPVLTASDPATSGGIPGDTSIPVDKAPTVTETNNSITTNSGGIDIVVDKAPTVTETNNSITTNSGGIDIVVDKPDNIDQNQDPSLNDQNFDTFSTLTEPQDIPLPMGADIPDINDPNLTPEQIASLSPGDLKARMSYYGETSTDPNEEIVVTGAKGLTGKVTATQASATAQDQANFKGKADWRVRLSLAPGSNYLYNSSNPGILKPLSSQDGTDGVIFPYTPQIQVTYAAKYSTDSPTHSNYNINQYTSSAVDQVSISGEFTAQDVAEANYLLAVIHFFRTMTKMFYGQDQNPKPGTPPPLCYIYGLGDYQFSAHPLAITNFTYSLPTDVDYIKTQAPSPAGSLQESIQAITSAVHRLGSAISPGGTKPPPNYGASQQGAGVGTTWVPTRIQLSITCLPIISRNQVSNKFSLNEYANGNLLIGNIKTGGGMW